MSFQIAITTARGGTPAQEQTIDVLCERIARLQERWPLNTRRRILISFAGVPGSGKSTISSALLATLKSRGVERVAVVPMDGFHYRKSVLAGFDDPNEAFRRRGAPFTFDANAFSEAVNKLKDVPVTEEDDPILAVRLPSFDHAKQDPVDDDIYISSSTQVLVIEGNYLLFDEYPWNSIAKQMDEGWFVDVSATVAKQRLAQRHLDAGLEIPWKQQ